MSPKTFSRATLSFLSAVLVGLIMMAGCGGGSSSSPPPGSPAVTLSPTSLTFSSGVGVPSAAQSVTVTDSGSATLSFSGITVSPSSFAQSNNCGANIAAGGSCTISVTFTPSATGTVSGALTITDNASNSPQTVTLSGTGNTLSVSPTSLAFWGVAVGTTSTSQSVTLSNAGTTPVAVTSITISGDFSQTNTCGTSVAGSGSCTISVIFAPQGSGPWTGTLTIVDAAGTQTVALTGSTAFANTAQVTVSFGPNGQSGEYYNGVFTTVTVCEPGSTTNCATIPNVLVDTGSVGLRVLSSGAAGVTTQVGSLNLPPVMDPTTGYPLYECVQYADLSYTWGPMQMATVQIGGETASQVPGGTANSGIPIQVIGTGTPPSVVEYNGGIYANPCLTNPVTGAPSGGLDDDNVTTLGSNGILGIAVYQQDCGDLCTTLATTSGQYLAYDTSTGDAYVEPTPLVDQAWNPVLGFPVDNNGVSLQLPSIPAAGQATATGTLTFGISTETNNAIPSTATTYETDCEGDFPQATFNGVNYLDVNDETNCQTVNASYIDSGSNALYFLDPGTLASATGLSTVNCSDNPWYCPTSTLNLSPPNLGLTLYGLNGTSGTVSLSIANADSLIDSADGGNPGNAALFNLGGTSISSGETSVDDSIDLGLPFFFGRTIFVGIAGTSTAYPNGYWAF